MSAVLCLGKGPQEAPTDAAVQVQLLAQVPSPAQWIHHPLSATVSLQ